MAIESLAEALREWSRGCKAVLAIGLVGSFARGSERPGSDVDLVVIAEDPRTLLSDVGWTRQFGELKTAIAEDYGLVQSLRCREKHGREIEFGIAPRVWCEPPIDPGTAQVIRDGMISVYDPHGYLRVAAAWVASNR